MKWILGIGCLDSGWFEVQGFHDFQRSVCVVGGVAELARSQFGGRPVAGGDGFGFREAHVEHGSHGRAHADLALVASFPESVVEVENGVGLDSQAVSDLPVIVFQPEPHFFHAFGLDEIGDHSQAVRAMELEDERFVREGKLDDVRPAAFLAGPECRLGLGIESGDARRQNFLSGRLALCFRFRDMNAVRRKPGEGLKKRCFRFRWRDRPGFARWTIGLRRRFVRLPEQSRDRAGKPRRRRGMLGLYFGFLRQGLRHLGKVDDM